MSEIEEQLNVQMQNTLNIENIFSGTGSPLKETLNDILSISPIKSDLLSNQNSPTKKSPVKILKKENLIARDFNNGA
jgi:hypothetical protein